MTVDFRVCVIGAGKIGEALIRGLTSRGVVKPDNILAVEVSEERRNHISKVYGVMCRGEPTGDLKDFDVTIIAVKPKDVRGVAEAIGKYMTQGLVITLAAGISTNFLAGILIGIPIIRAMPNISVLIGEGMVALARGPNTTPEHIRLAEKIFSSVGRIVWVEEKDMDAVTGLSGSGPAYIFSIIEALSDGGVKMGLEKGLAMLLAAQTTLGAAKMILETGEQPSKLIGMVATPGGTTVAGLKQLEESKVHEALIRAVAAAAERSKELMLDQIRGG
ncbi:MAG: pyrroline-5-carboxylate reductase [Candidatus Bathyarchaeia archaeon]